MIIASMFVALSTDPPTLKRPQIDCLGASRGSELTIAAALLSCIASGVVDKVVRDHCVDVCSIVNGSLDVEMLVD